MNGQGLARRPLAAGTGRWWSAWGVTDLVAVGDKVVLADPSYATPFENASELTQSGPDEARISQASAFANHGEAARLVRGGDGAVTEVLIAGRRSIAGAALAAELVGRYERQSPTTRARA